MQLQYHNGRLLACQNTGEVHFYRFTFSPPMVMKSWKSTFRVPRSFAGAISAHPNQS